MGPFKCSKWFTLAASPPPPTYRDYTMATWVPGAGPGPPDRSGCHRVAHNSNLTQIPKSRTRPSAVCSERSRNALRHRYQPFRDSTHCSPWWLLLRLSLNPEPGAAAPFTSHCLLSSRVTTLLHSLVMSEEASITLPVVPGRALPPDRTRANLAGKTPCCCTGPSHGPVQRI